MKAKVVYSLFSVALFSLGACIGGYLGISASAGSNTNELYASSLQLLAAHQLIRDGEYDKAQEFICDSLKTKFSILELSQQILNADRSSEIDKIQINFEQQLKDSSLGETCV